jgi:putative membrane protein
VNNESALSRWFPHGLAGAFAVFWTVMAINPVMRDVWWAENLPVMAVFLLLAGTYGRFRFSNLAYVLMACWLVLHTIGGHYTFANVPFGFVTDLFGFERNHFDRLGHYSIGFYAFPIAEYLTRRNLARPVVAYLFGLFAIMALAAGYEIIEWWYAVTAGGEAGIEFLGSQGDIWDAQSDMLCDTLGAVTALVLFFFSGIKPERRVGLGNL